MAKFTINKGYGNESAVEADRYVEEGSYIGFYDDQDVRVASISAQQVGSVHREATA